MKKNLFVLIMAAMSLAACNDHQLEGGETFTGMAEPSADSEYKTLLERVRWGDADACVKMADFYRVGNSAKPNFIGMLAMLEKARLYSDKFKVGDYFCTLPETDSFRQFYEVVDRLNKDNLGKAKECADKFIADGNPDGYVIYGIIQVEQGDTIGGLEKINYAAEQGSDFGELFACVAPVLFDKAQKPDIGGMMKIAEKNPWAYALVADQYTGIDCKSIRDDKLATYYFQKADEFGFLSQRGARWLMNYYMKNNVQIDEVEKQRLQKLSNWQEWEKLFEDDDLADDNSLEFEEPCIIEEVDTLEYD